MSGRRKHAVLLMCRKETVEYFNHTSISQVAGLRWRQSGKVSTCDKDLLDGASRILKGFLCKGCEMDVTRPRSLLRDAFDAANARTGRLPVSSPPTAQRQHSSFSASPSPKNSATDATCLSSDDEESALYRGGIAAELRAILMSESLAPRGSERCNIFGCSPPPRDSFPLIRDVSFTEQLVNHSATPQSWGHPSSQKEGGINGFISFATTINIACSESPASVLSAA